MLLLITGAAGKVGTALIARIAADLVWRDTPVRALVHNRMPTAAGSEVVCGSIPERADVDRAMAGVSHVIHRATC